LQDRIVGKITLRCVIQKYGVRVAGGWNWFRIDSSGGICITEIETAGSITGELII
jgi:hypothetical protein